MGNLGVATRPNSASGRCPYLVSGGDRAPAAVWSVLERFPQAVLPLSALASFSEISFGYPRHPAVPSINSISAGSHGSHRSQGGEAGGCGVVEGVEGRQRAAEHPPCWLAGGAPRALRQRQGEAGCSGGRRAEGGGGQQWPGGTQRAAKRGTKQIELLKVPRPAGSLPASGTSRPPLLCAV